MSTNNDFYLLHGEPGYHGGEVDYGSTEPYEHGTDGACDDADCCDCDPRCLLEYSPVRASFAIDIDTGAVSEVG